MSSKIGTYKGYPTISLKGQSTDPDNYAFTFGLAKAELILAHLDDIKAFVVRFQTEPSNEPK